MAETTRVKLRIDTGAARQDLAGVVREARATSGKISAGIQGTIGRGLGAVGLGGGIATGMQAVRGATESGFGALIGETLGSVGAQIEDYLLGDLGVEAKASKQARDETIQAFGMQAGLHNKVPPGAKNYFESIKSLRQQQEQGRKVFEMNSDFFGPGVGDMIDRIGKKLGEELKKAVDYLLSELPIVGGFF